MEKLDRIQKFIDAEKSRQRAIREAEGRLNFFLAVKEPKLRALQQERERLLREVEEIREEDKQDFSDLIAPTENYSDLDLRDTCLFYRLQKQWDLERTSRQLNLKSTEVTALCWEALSRRAPEIVCFCKKQGWTSFSVKRLLKFKPLIINVREE